MFHVIDIMVRRIGCKVGMAEVKNGKCQKIKKYAIWDSDVKAKEKYRVTTLPTKFFSSRQEAHAFAKKRGWEPSDYKVMVW